MGVSPLICCNLIEVDPARVSIDSSVGFTSEVLVYKYLNIVLVEEGGGCWTTGVSLVNFFGVSGNFTDFVTWNCLTELRIV